ncbi:MAG TPA: HlyD family efflux transporter periplasmic adaptor subunit [Flavisolibacter sp.]|nr:HlyD family efflux transporter periplasmic adaptor subunit [Flavisolibacter sp.]
MTPLSMVVVTRLFNYNLNEATMNSRHFTAYHHVYRQHQKNKVKTWFLVLLLSLALILFLPWTQNIRAKGTVTALKQEQRPQQINTIIGGRIEKWFIREGDYVKKGDTILQLSEVKADYLDPRLLERTAEQITAKQTSVSSYENKAGATAAQIDALRASLQTKLNQLTNKYRQAEVKLQSDSMDVVATTNEFSIASLQYNRQKALHDSGLVSLTQLEQRNQAFQSALAKKISAENKYLASRQELGIIRFERTAVAQEYSEKVSKAESDRFGALSSLASSQGEIAKLQNQYASYAIRNGMYYIIAPQSGQIVQAGSTGIGEVVKEGDMLVHIVPDGVDYAVEMYVRPVDLPLVATGQKVRFLFDGFPAIVFSGWPEASYGTFQGIVSAVESDVSANGKFKLLVQEDRTYRKWPKELRMGTGANGIALLKNVPLWYELWRNINSFPPDYYQQKKEEAAK